MVILFAALLLGQLGEATPLSPIPDENHLQVEVDPRHELLSIVHYISNFRVEGWRLKTHLDFDYTRRVTEAFLPFKDHPAVKRFEELSEAGFTLSAPMGAMLHVSGFPELELVHSMPEGLEKRAGGEEGFREFLRLLRDFAEQSQFAEFRRENRSLYEGMVRRYREKIAGRNYVGILEDYMGTTKESYTVILNPLLGSFNIGSKVVREDGTTDIFNISGPKTLDEEGHPVFGSTDGIRNLIWHEFAHAFTNPLVAEHKEAIDRHAHLFEPMKERMARSGYPQWDICVDEHIVRAINIRLNAMGISEAEAQRLLESDLKAGFTYVPHLTERLEEYEGNRDAYPTLGHFFPRILELFAEMSPGL